MSQLFSSMQTKEYGSYGYEPYSDALVEPDKNDKLLFSAMDGASVLVQQPERVIEL